MQLDRLIAVRNNKTIYRDGDVCIKVFNADFTKSDVLNEALNQSRIEETDLKVPKVLEVTMIDGKWAIVSEFIKGKTLSQLMEESPEKKREFIEKLIDIQLDIQSKECPLLGRLDEVMKRKISVCDLDATTRYELLIRLENMPKHNKICHGDLAPSNIIITENSDIYILDWSHAAKGGASADAAKTYLLFRLNNDDSAAEEYLELFCEKSKTQKEYIEKWLPIAAASQSVKCNKKERGFLLSLADISARNK